MNMDRKTALGVLKDYQAWRRYNGPIVGFCIPGESAVIGQALDVAIHELERLCQEPPKREFYGQ